MPSPDSDPSHPSANPFWRLPLALLLLCGAALWGDIKETETGSSDRTGFVGQLERLIGSGDAVFAAERTKKQNEDDGPHWDNDSVDTTYRYWLNSHEALPNPTPVPWAHKRAPYFVPASRAPPTV